MIYSTEGSLKVWLKELQTSIEVESLNALQAKSVATTPQTYEAFLIRDSHITVQQIRAKSTQIIERLDYFIDQLPITYNTLSLTTTNFSHIYRQIQAIVYICRQKAMNNKLDIRIIDSVRRSCEQTNKLIDFSICKKSVNNSQLESTLRKLKENFGELINVTIKSECKVITDSLYKRTGMLSMKWSLLSCCSLAQNDAYMCRIFIESHNIVKPLIEMVNNYSLDSTTDQQQIKAIAIRVLTILCINREAVNTLINECIYNQFLTHVITNESSELIIKEAVDLMLQLTKPLVDSCHMNPGYGFDTHIVPQLVINDFIHSLVKVIKTVMNKKIVLLSCATFANISFVDIDCLVENDVLNLILNDTTLSEDIFIRDQIITIVANISRKYPLEVVSSGGLVYIISSLQLKSEDLKESDQLEALQRIQLKVCVSVARLASNPSIAQILFRLNAVQRLIHLCKHPKERQFSDNVLMACMAALKRLSNTCPPTSDMPQIKPFKQINL